MFTLRFELKNPFSRDYFKNLGSIHGRITKHKAWELEHTFYDGQLVDVDISWLTQRDHAGINVVVGLLGYAIHFSIYDTRHWDYGLGTWEK